MRAYNVHIIAEDATGNKIKFVEVAEYPERATDRSGCVRESEREAKAILRRDQRFMAPVRESISKEIVNRLYKGWTIKLIISFYFLRLLKYSPFRSYVRHVADHDRQFLKIIQADKADIQNAWNEFEKFFFMNEDCNYSNGIFSPGIGNSEEEAKEKAKALVLKVKTALDQAGWAYKPIKAKVQGYPGWITVEEHVKVWDEVEQFLLHRIRTLEC